MQYQLSKKIYQGSYPLQVAAYIVAFLMWILPDIVPALGARSTQPVFVLFMGQIELWSWPMYLSRIVALLLYVAVLVYLYFVCDRMQILAPRAYTFPILTALIFSSLGYVQVFDHRIIAFFFVVLLYRQLFDVYYQEKQVKASFLVIVYAYIASLFVPEMIWLSLLLIPALFMYKLSSMRFISGIFLAFLFIGAVTFGAFWVIDSMDILLNFIEKYIDWGFWIWIGEFRRADVLMAVFGVVLALVVMGLLLKNSPAYKLNLRLHSMLVSVLFWMSLVWFSLFLSHYEVILPVLLLPMVIFFSAYFALSYRRSDDIILTILIAVCVVYRMLWLFGY